MKTCRVVSYKFHCQTIFVELTVLTLNNAGRFTVRDCNKIT